MRRGPNDARSGNVAFRARATCLRSQQTLVYLALRRRFPMPNTLRICGRLVLAAALPLAGAAWSAEPLPAAKANQPVADAVKEILNRGAALYNQGDRNGCAHLFE